MTTDELAASGDPAFPCVPGAVYKGMTLRDYFAAAALTGGLEQGLEDEMAGLSPDRDAWWHPSKKIAKRAYAIADAMLKEAAK